MGVAAVLAWFAAGPRAEETPAPSAPEMQAAEAHAGQTAAPPAEPDAAEQARKIEAARTRLRAQMEKDQQVRADAALFYSDEVVERLRATDPDAADWVAAARETARRTPGAPKTWEEHRQRLHAVDAETAKVLAEVERSFGWPDAKRFGKEAAHDAALMIHHVHIRDPELFQRALASVRKQVAEGILDPGLQKMLEADVASAELAKRKKAP
ncbi:MAG: hypothetical protein KIS92_25580 [Planctomycetota bacterium]|nr:hypothetical protein [Planctomycetota bacterium]